MHRSSLANIAKMPRYEIKTFLDSFNTVFSDCDGVLWLGDEVLDKSPNVLNRLREMGKRIFYITNNSTKLRDELVAKARKLGYIAYKDEIISTSYLAACYLHNLGFNKKAYIIGSKGVTQELDLLGIKHTEIGPEVMEESLKNLVETVHLDKDVGAVIVGFDEHFSYPKMLKAANYLSQPDCLFIGTNSDDRIPSKRHLVVPGAGCILKCIEIAAGREALVVGKPSAYISDLIMKKYNVDPKKTLMIGDKCNTDILLGKRCGFQTLLVLTGVTTLNEVNVYKHSELQSDQDLVPDFYLEKLGDLETIL